MRKQKRKKVVEKEPVFILACCPRVGSTWLQRACVSTKDILIWGETVSLVFPYGDWFTTDTSGPNDLHAFREKKADMWMAVLNPLLEDAFKARKGYIEALYAEAAKKEGYSRWGIKATSWSQTTLDFIRWAWPKSKVIFIQRDFAASLRSRFKSNTSVQGYSRQADIKEFCNIYLSQMKVAMDTPEDDLTKFVRYEDLLGNKRKMQSLVSWLGLGEVDFTQCDRPISKSSFSTGRKDMVIDRPGDRETIQEYQRELNRVLKENGYEELQITTWRKKLKHMYLLTKCSLCGCSQYELSRRNKIPIMICCRCGTIRQGLIMSEKELQDYYENKYHSGIYKHSMEQDLKVASVRLDAYQIKPKTTLLDVGSGNGAFVEEARKRGIRAVGCELAKGCPGEFIYNQALENIFFPTDHFDTITVHDVLEHLTDPAACLKEIFRVLKQKGELILDLPNFHVPEGKHHWKEVEHLWFFTEREVLHLFDSAGFRVEKVESPIPSKLVFYASKPVQKRVKILVPPGIGDIYWSLTKIKSFCEQKGLGLPDVYIASPRPERDRSLDFVRSVPFVNAAGYKEYACGKDPIFQEAYREDGRTIFKDVCGCDYFIAYNGIMRFGKSIDATDTEYTTEWLFPTFSPIEARGYGEEAEKLYGKYIVAYFIPQGMYKRWLEAFNVDQVAATLHKIAQHSGCRVLLVGAKWDKKGMDVQLMERDSDQHFINLTGQTSWPQVCQLMKDSQGVIGFPSGLTIMAAKMRVPTLMFWHSYFNEKFWWFACPPQSRGNWYDVIDVENTSEDAIDQRFSEMVGYNASPKFFHESVKSQEEEVVPEVEPEPEVEPDVPEPEFEPREFKAEQNGALTVACILRSGGDFTTDYVGKLRRAVERQLSESHHFVCMTDFNKEEIDAEHIALVHDWPGWWSKIELFRPGLFSGPVLYFDLDTVLTGSVDELAEREHTFAMLHGFRYTGRRASGVMAWGGDYSHIYTEFVSAADSILSINPRSAEQLFIHRQLKRKYRMEPEVVQDMIQVASFKRHCIPAGHRPPKGTKIVCFHGHPRPNEVELPWVKENWK